MEDLEHLNELYLSFEEVVDILRKELNVTFTEALVETFDNLEHQKIKVEANAPSAKIVELLTKKYANLEYEKLETSVKSHLFYLLTLKAADVDNFNSTQLPTPRILATIVALLWSKIVPQTAKEVIDPAIGSGTLLFSLIDQLRFLNHSKNSFVLTGIDNDPAMLDLADVSSYLNKLPVDLLRQDALQPWLTGKKDVAVSDVPVGYYPLDNNAKNFDNCQLSGQSFAHILFIEQIIKNLKPSGYAFLIVPKMILSGKEAADFMTWLTKKVNILAVVDLPDDLFANMKYPKSILVLQNHGQKMQLRKVLVTKLGSLKDKSSLVKLNVELNNWVNE